MMTWAERIREYRRLHPQAGGKTLTQTQLATLWGISVQTVQGWESGRREPVGLIRQVIDAKLSLPQK